MSLSHPELLWLCLLAPLDLALAIIRYPSLSTGLSRLAGPRLRESHRSAYRGATLVGVTASALFVLCAVFSLAGPSWGERGVRVERRGLELAVVLDVSRSMTVREAGKSRLEEAKDIVRGLFDAVPGAAFSLIAAKGEAVLLVPMTEDFEALADALDYADPETMTAAGTNLGSGLRVALDSFSDSTMSNRLILLLSDGGDLEGRAVKAAEAVRAKRVSFFAVGIGSAEALPVPGVYEGALIGEDGAAVVSALEPAKLKAIAEAARGRYIEASETSARKMLADELKVLGRGGSRLEFEVGDRSGLFAFFALLFAALRVLAEGFAERGGRLR